jgi:hypothetical protein
LPEISEGKPDVTTILSTPVVFIHHIKANTTGIYSIQKIYRTEYNPKVLILKLIAQRHFSEMLPSPPVSKLMYANRGLRREVVYLG